MAASTIPVDVLLDRLNYDPLTGLFTWRRCPRRPSLVGEVTGSKRPDGYLFLSVSGVRLLAHRAAWAYIFGAFPTEFIDHINGQRDDNRIANLRPTSPQMNRQNQTRAKPGTDLPRGVQLTKQNNYRVGVMIDGRYVYLGTYRDREEAIEAAHQSRLFHYPGYTGQS